MKGYQILTINDPDRHSKSKDYILLFYWKSFGLFEEEITDDKKYLHKSINDCMNYYTIPGFFEEYRDFKLNQLLK